MVLRMVQITYDQLPRFEKMMEENGFKIVWEDNAEIPAEVQKEMERRSASWDDNQAIPADIVLKNLRSRL